MPGASDTESLARLRYLDQRLADAAGAVAGLVEDETLAAELRRFAADHRRHAERIDDAFAALGPGPSGIEDAFELEVSGNVDRVREAPDAAEAMRALLDAERDAMRRYSSVLEDDVSQGVGMMLREHIDDESQHLRYLERRAPAADAGGETRARSEGGGGERLPGQPLPDTELPPAPPDAETYVDEDAHVRRGTPGEAGGEVAERPPSGGEGFPGGGDMEEPEVERQLEDL